MIQDTFWSLAIICKNRVRTLHSIVITDEEESCDSQLDNPCAHDSNFSYWHFPLSEIHEH
jgi:hypothetical protein